MDIIILINLQINVYKYDFHYEVEKSENDIVILYDVI